MDIHEIAISVVALVKNNIRWTSKHADEIFDNIASIIGHMEYNDIIKDKTFMKRIEHIVYCNITSEDADIIRETLFNSYKKDIPDSEEILTACNGLDYLVVMDIKTIYSKYFIDKYFVKKYICLSSHNIETDDGYHLVRDNNNEYILHTFKYNDKPRYIAHKIKNYDGTVDEPVCD